MKQKSFIHYFILLFLSIGLVSCDKDDEVVNDDNTGERTFAEICKEVSDIDYAIVDYYKRCKSIEQLKEYADKIRAIKGVEEVYFNESTTMFVKIKDFRKMSYSYFPEPDESALETIHQTAKRVKADIEVQEKDEVYSHQTFNDAKLLVVNQQTDREWSRLSGGVVRSIFSNLGFETDLVNSPDIEFFRNDIFDCDYLFLITHGVYDKKDNRHWVKTSVPVERDANNKLIPSFLEKYHRFEV